MAATPHDQPLVKLLPNALSALRLALALTLPLMKIEHLPWVVVTAGVTDLLDGFIARRYRVTSWQGGLLDAVADKLFVLSALVTLTTRGLLPTWALPLLLSRDVTVALIALYAVGIRQWAAFKKMPARLPGKVATAVLYMMLLVVLFADESRAAIVAVAVAAALCFLAAIDYAVRFVHARRTFRAAGR